MWNFLLAKQSVENKKVVVKYHHTSNAKTKFTCREARKQTKKSMIFDINLLIKVSD